MDDGVDRGMTWTESHQIFAVSNIHHFIIYTKRYSYMYTNYVLIFFLYFISFSFFHLFV